MADKVMFITGASSGIGLATVKYFVEKGWKVAATMRNPNAVPELLNMQGVKTYALDVTNRATVTSVVQSVIHDFKKIDVVINNAGYGAIGPFEGADEEQLFAQMNTNFFGTTRIIAAFLPHFKSNGGGTFINLSSIAGRMAMPLYSIYHASKYAVEGFTESLSYELRSFNIRVRLVEPGPIKTEFNGRSRVDLVPSDFSDYKDFVEKIDSFYGAAFKRAEDVSVVVKSIYRAAICKSYKLRFPAGIQAKALLLFNKVLPNRWFRWIVRKTMRI